MSQPDIAVIGAGYAGMAAAVTLAQHNIPCTVYEASTTLGGRARRIALPGSPHALDNGQHLLLGAYHTTLRLIDAVNPGQPFLRLPLQLFTENGLRLHAPRLPAPWHTLFALLGARGLSLNERFSALGFMLRQRAREFRLTQDQTLASLLASQPARLTHLLWEPLCLAAVNTPIGQASAQVFLNVLQDSLLGKRSDSDLILPATDLSALFPEAAARYVTERGGQVWANQRVQTIQITPGGYQIGTRQFRFVVCAVAPQPLVKLLPTHPALTALTRSISRFHYQPSATVYVQYAPQIRLARCMTGLTGALTQWVFDRGHTHRQRGLFAAVISATPQAHTGDALARQVAAELHQHLGLPAAPLWARAITEKRATFSCDAGLVRPPPHTPLPGFHLAGDYTASPYPATLEAATQSGVQCGHHI